LLKNSLRTKYLFGIVFVVCFASLFYFSIPILKRYLYGFGGDPCWVSWYIWWINYAAQNALDWTHSAYVSFPFGLDFTASPQYPVFDFLSRTCARWLNEIAAHNILVLLSFPLSFCTMYLLVKKITVDKYAAILCAAIYAFCPYHTAHSLQHLSLSQIQWFPLYIFALIHLYENTNARNIFFVAVTLSIIVFTDYYYVYFTIFITAVFIVIKSVSRNTRYSLSHMFGVLFGVCVISAIIVIPFLFAEMKGVFSVKGPSIVAPDYNRSIIELLTFSAKPFDYLLPPYHNPFIGSYLPDFGLSPFKGHRLTEHTLYLGVMPLLLFFFSVWCALRRTCTLSPLQKSMLWFSMILCVVAGLLSLPPILPLGEFSFDPLKKEIIAAHTVYLPSYYLNKIIPFFRCYARFGLLVMLGVTIAAGIGYAHINNKIISVKRKVVLLIGCLLVVVIEFSSLPPVMYIDTENIPPEYVWLKDQNDDAVVVEYPFGDDSDSYTTQEYVFYGRYHGNKLVNGTASARGREKFKSDVRDITTDKAKKILKMSGVKYVIIHRNKYSTGNKYVALDWITKVPEDKIFPIGYMSGKIPDPTSDNELVLEKRFPDTDVYRLKD